MNDISNILGEFDSVLRKYNRTNYDRLEMPLPADKVESTMYAWRVKNDEFRQLFLWKNGNDPRKDSERCELHDYGSFLSMEYIIEIRERKHKWSGDFIPIGMDDEGQALLFNNEPGKDYGKIHLYSVPEFYIERPISIFDSIGTMLRTYTEAYKQGLFVLDEEINFIDIEDGYEGFGESMNPNSQYWRR
ncbi:MAG TPA: SMI1/KNR4 family protein [Dinghuibacter sp.]|uniref:SMI1/KNR4 family protein n=1 Tax=Dinghuibacter sp. TaxID=2024697 RepID=UPI002C561592|nr:SMI1/KNR4 family protein [Dinghuibacter sp.]HTJ11439.1 SMI1/KNR4 family protein [Dinghuibacter sp.]